MTLALPLLLAVAVVDPRPQIVHLALEGQLRPALAATENALAADPERGRALGLDYLRADLLQRVGRRREAVEGFARAMAAPLLAPWSRFRLALAQEELGHPEVAAGLAATLSPRDRRRPWSRPALELLRRALAAGGDCRLLAGLRRERLPGAERRTFDLTAAECLARRGRSGRGARGGDRAARAARSTTRSRATRPSCSPASPARPTTRAPRGCWASRLTPIASSTWRGPGSSGRSPILP